MRNNFNNHNIYLSQKQRPYRFTKGFYPPLSRKYKFTYKSERFDFMSNTMRAGSLYDAL